MIGSSVTVELLRGASEARRGRSLRNNDCQPGRQDIATDVDPSDSVRSLPLIQCATGQGLSPFLSR